MLVLRGVYWAIPRGDSFFVSLPYTGLRTEYMRNYWGNGLFTSKFGHSLIQLNTTVPFEKDKLQRHSHATTTSEEQDFYSNLDLFKVILHFLPSHKSPSNHHLGDYFVFQASKKQILGKGYTQPGFCHWIFIFAVKNDSQKKTLSPLKQILSHTIHGTGIFTYINGWFLW